MRTEAMVTPFGEEEVEEVHLPRAPLVRALAQVRFPKMLSLATEAGVGEVQEALRHAYPILNQEKTMGVLITPNGVAPSPQETEAVWRLQSKDSTWTVSLGTTFVALDTNAYVSRDDFCCRLEEVLQVIARTVEPVVAERVGLRYTDRLDEPEQLRSLQELVRPEILGGYAVALPEGVSLGHTLCESSYTLEGGQLIARWGVLPAGAVIDPGVPPVSRQSWILDLDVFRVARVDFDVAELDATIRRFADQAYRFFRWAVTDDLLRRAGGDL
jgi:uncharacterized protein (TIGR04255 family)